MTDDDILEQTKGSAIGDQFALPINLFNSLRDKIGIDTPNHPAYFYVQIWVKIAHGVWKLKCTLHSSEYED